MAGISQRHGLAVLFGVLALALAGIGVAGVRAGVWPVGLAALALGGWLGSLSLSTIRGSRGRK